MEKIGKEKALAIAHKMRDEFIFNYAKAEGNSLTFAETQSVINGFSVGGKRMAELHQIEHIRDAWDEIIKQVKEDTFSVDKQNFIYINSLVAEGENIELGGFRHTHVHVTGTEYITPHPMILGALFREMVQEYHDATDYEKGFVLFLHSARNQYFYDGNKRTGQLMMNGELMTQGYAPISITPASDTQFRETLINFYINNDKQVMIDFLLECAKNPRFNFYQTGTYLSEEAQERINFIPFITGGGRAEAVFRDFAKSALQDNEACVVDWRQIEMKTVLKAIGELGYSANSVIRAISQYSPTCITPTEISHFAEQVAKIAPDLQKTFMAKSKQNDKSQSK